MIKIYYQSPSMINASHITKRILLSAGLILFSFAAGAQQIRKATLGLRAGGSVSNIVVQSTGQIGSPQYFGPYNAAKSFFIAGDLEYKVGNSLGIVTGLSFIGKGSESAIASGDNTKFFVVQVPVNVVKDFHVGKQTLFAGAGSYVSYIVAGMKKDPNHVPNDVRTLRIFPEDDLLLRVDAGLHVMAGLKFSSRFKVQAGYDYGLVKILRAYYGNWLFSRALTVGLGYQIRK
ncbi:MAG: hypothetical protein EOO88_31130 [Pedobacter sp.]|nr:MAG: hypothetical protein EOO88_31130 [Pedobacter sp.]